MIKVSVLEFSVGFSPHFLFLCSSSLSIYKRVLQGYLGVSGKHREGLRGAGLAQDHRPGLQCLRSEESRLLPGLLRPLCRWFFFTFCCVWGFFCGFFMFFFCFFFFDILASRKNSSMCPVNSLVRTNLPGIMLRVVFSHTRWLAL